METEDSARILQKSAKNMGQSNVQKMMPVSGNNSSFVRRSGSSAASSAINHSRVAGSVMSSINSPSRGDW